MIICAHLFFSRIKAYKNTKRFLERKHHKKMDQPKISVVVPIYNSELYLRECLDSICNQTLKDIEILCVDAGSSDGTLDILEDYQDGDRRIKVVNSSKKSMGYQYNLGIRLAQGEYIGFVETDDFIAPEMYKELYMIAEEYDVDIIRSDWYSYTEESLTYMRVLSNNELYNNLAENGTRGEFIHDGNVEHWSGLYKKEFLQKNKIKYNETPGASYQDISFLFLAYVYCRKLYYLDRAFYYYRKDNPNSSIHDSDKVFCVFDELEYTLQRTMSISNSNKIRGALGYYFFPQILKCLRRTQEEKQEPFVEKIKSEYKVLYEKGLCDESYFHEEELVLLKELMDNPKEAIISHRRQQKEFLASLSKITNLIIIGKGMMANWIINKLPNVNGIIANITSDSLDEYTDYKDDAQLLVAVKNSNVRDDIINRLLEAGFKNYITIPYGLFEF